MIRLLIVEQLNVSYMFRLLPVIGIQTNSYTINRIVALNGKSTDPVSMMKAATNFEDGTDIYFTIRRGTRASSQFALKGA